jgi:hypothetical protein
MLGLIPLNHTIIVRRTDKDEWGIEAPNGVEKFYRVRVDYNIEEAKLSIANGSETVITGAVVFLGKVDIKTTDILVINDEEYSPKTVKPITDFGENVIHTRVLF